MCGQLTRVDKFIVTVKNFKRSCSEYFPFLYTGRKAKRESCCFTEKKVDGAAAVVFSWAFGSTESQFFFFPLQITNNVVLDLWVVCIKMFLNSVNLNLT